MIKAEGLCTRLIFIYYQSRTACSLLANFNVKGLIAILPSPWQVSVMHSVQAGYTEKALSYADKALQFIQQQKGVCVCVMGGGRRVCVRGEEGVDQ